MPERKPPVVLNIEDDQVQHELMKRVLGSAGILEDQFIYANNASEARRLLDPESDLFKSPPDLIILDLFLSGTNEDSGLSLLEDLKDPQSLYLNTPIIIVTSGSNFEIRRRCHELKVDGFIIKPFERENLLDLVKEALEPHNRHS